MSCSPLGLRSVSQHFAKYRASAPGLSNPILSVAMHVSILSYFNINSDLHDRCTHSHKFVFTALVFIILDIFFHASNHAKKYKNLC